MLVAMELARLMVPTAMTGANAPSVARAYGEILDSIRVPSLEQYTVGRAKKGGRQDSGKRMCT